MRVGRPAGCDRGRRLLGNCPFPIELGSKLPHVTGGGRVGHSSRLASEHREWCSMQRRSGYGKNLSFRCYSPRIETLACLVDVVSMAVTHALAKQEAPVSRPKRRLVERRDDVTLPWVTWRRSLDRPALGWLLQVVSSRSISPPLRHSKICSFYT